jgi:hypothetical protein
MRRLLAAWCAAALLVGAVVAAPALARATTPRATHPSALATPPRTPAKGIAITFADANLLTDAKAMAIANPLFAMVAHRLHANAVSLNFPFWEDGSASNDPERAPMTPSPQRLMEVTAVAQRYHLMVQWRPYLYEANLTFGTHNSISPTNPSLWIENYWRFLRPYLQAANLAGVQSFSVALELRSMLPYLSDWTTLVRESKTLYAGELLYSQQHTPQISLPLTARGYDAYQPIRLPGAVSAKAFTTGFERNLQGSGMQSTPQDLTLEEVSIPAVRNANLSPASFNYPSGTPIDRTVQTDWFQGACNAFYALHLSGIYYYAIAFDWWSPRENKSRSIYGWLGTLTQTIIARCFERTDPGPTVPQASGPTVAWGADQPVEPSGGHPSSISCPTPAFCVVVDRGGDVTTESAGTWSPPIHLGDGGLVAVSCATATSCVSVDGQGDAFTYDGASWNEAAHVDAVPLTAVSCAPGTTTCVAVDVAGNVLTEVAGSWSAPVHVASSPFTAVSCPAPGGCVAGDAGGAAYTQHATGWSVQRLGSAGLTALACTTSACVAGDDTGRVYRESGGTGWRWRARATPGAVASVSCVAAASCDALSATADVLVHKGPSVTGSTDVFPGDQAVAISCAPGGPCTAVSYGGQVAVRHASWGAPRRVDGRPGNLTGVSCSAPTSCVAVDDAGRASIYDGTRWSTPQLTGLASASGVSCAGTFCAVVSNAGTVVEYVGGRWGKPRVVDSNALTAVSCVSASFCVAADAADHVLLFNGQRWTAPRSDGAQPWNVRGFTAVACASPAVCLAAGTYGGMLFFGTGRPHVHQADTLHVPITGVSCGALTFCVAVDERGRAIVTTLFGTALLWGKPKQVDRHRLTAVSCAPGGFCLAVDDAGGAVAYLHGAWSTTSTAIPLVGALSAVACATGGTCAVTGADATAVGTGS